jgi:hypothetical protein
MSGFTPCINEPVFGFSAFEAMLLYKATAPDGVGLRSDLLRRRGAARLGFGRNAPLKSLAANSPFVWLYAE